MMHRFAFYTIASIWPEIVISDGDRSYETGKQKVDRHNSTIELGIYFQSLLVSVPTLSKVFGKSLW